MIYILYFFKLFKMVNLILLGGGKSKFSDKLNSHILDSLPKNRKRILFIPHAMDPLHRTHQSCFDEIKGAFKTINFNRIDNLKDLSISEKEILKYGAVYIGGGNTFLLSHLFTYSGFKNKLRKLIDSGMLIIGNSAGSILLGKDISFAHDENKVNLTDMGGLNYIKDYSVYCHFTEEKYHKEILDYINRTKSSVIALTEDSGIHIMDDTILVIGTNSIRKYNADRFSNYNPGDSF